jgi:hypothetical protein
MLICNFKELPEASDLSKKLHALGRREQFQPILKVEHWSVLMVRTFSCVIIRSDAVTVDLNCIQYSNIRGRF